MKRCPICNREFSDSQSFCTADGSRLTPVAPAPENPPRRQEADDGGGTYGRVDVILPDGERLQRPLVAPETTIGSSSDNLISIQDAEVSRRHAVLRLVGETWYVIDLGSRNGTYLDRMPVGSQGVAINPGNTVYLGKSLLNITLTPPEEERRPIPPQPGRPSVDRRPPPPSQQTYPGEKVLNGLYALESPLAQGKTYTVYRARRIRGGDFVAVKLLNPELGRDSLALDAIAARLRSRRASTTPTPSRSFDFGSTRGRHIYLVEELLSGADPPRSPVAAERGLSIQRIVGTLQPDLRRCPRCPYQRHRAAQYQHRIDLRLLTEPSGGEVIKVGGFGLAKIQSPAGDPGSAVTVKAADEGARQAAVHVPGAMARQAPSIRGPTSTRSASSFLNCSTGEVPFDADDQFEIARMHLNSPVPDITKFSRRRSTRARHGGEPGARKDPARRPATALHLAAEFQAVSGGGGGCSAPSSSRPPAARHRPQVVPPAPPGAHAHWRSRPSLGRRRGRVERARGVELGGIGVNGRGLSLPALGRTD